MYDNDYTILAMITSVSRGKKNPYFNVRALTDWTGREIEGEYTGIRPIEFRPLAVDLDEDSLVFGSLDEANAVGGYPPIDELFAGKRVMLKVVDGRVEAWDSIPPCLEHDIQKVERKLELVAS